MVSVVLNGTNELSWICSELNIHVVKILKNVKSGTF
jgi:hypothetical protein